MSEAVESQVQGPRQVLSYLLDGCFLGQMTQHMLDHLQKDSKGTAAFLQTLEK